ncbi:MAG TPA: PilZ domain-containing protein [Candidatus Acidoferrales bacterium]|nr:PilZ domain-containing protein [Candidatus Acidoferrales bacterium]
MFWSKLFPKWNRKEQAADTSLQLSELPESRANKRADKRLDKRREPRLLAALPVFVYGRVEGQPFSEESETTNVSPHGGLLELSAEIERSHPILLTNLHTNEELACRVARVLKTETGRTLVGLEFLRPSPNFWSVDFSLHPQPHR